MEQQVFAKVLDGKVVSFPVMAKFAMTQKGSSKSYFKCEFQPEPEITATQRLERVFSVEKDKVVVSYKVMDKTANELLKEIANAKEVDLTYLSIIEDTVSRILADYLNTYAKFKYDFDDMVDAASYVSSSVDIYKSQAMDCMALRDKIWLAFHEYFDAIKNESDQIEFSVSRIVSKITDGGK